MGKVSAHASSHPTACGFHTCVHSVSQPWALYVRARPQHAPQLLLLVCRKLRRAANT
jgi:hypothetical protein